MVLNILPRPVQSRPRPRPRT